MARGNAEGRGTLTAKPRQVTALNQTITAGEDGGSTASETLRGMIQTNADIVPGDSGGPLANLNGQVIGIDAALDTLGSDPITGAQGGSIGLGFAIPVDQARRVIVQLIRTGQHALCHRIAAGNN